MQLQNLDTAQPEIVKVDFRVFREIRNFNLMLWVLETERSCDTYLRSIMTLILEKNESGSIFECHF